MMYNFNLEKILLQRAIRNTRGFSPLDNLFIQLENIIELNFEIEKNIESSKILQLSRKQMIVSLVTALEVFLKDSILLAYDSGSFYQCTLVQELKKKFFLKDIEAIIMHKITTGEILASIFTFTSLRSINHIFSLLIDKPFFKEINNFEFEIKEAVSETTSDTKTSKKKMLEEDRKIYFNLKELYSLRPIITHDQIDKSDISEFQVQYFISSIELFSMVIDGYLCSLMSCKTEEKECEMPIDNNVL